MGYGAQKVLILEANMIYLPASINYNNAPMPIVYYSFYLRADLFLIYRLYTNLLFALFLSELVPVSGARIEQKNA